MQTSKRTRLCGFRSRPKEANDEKIISKMSFSIYIYGFAIALFIFYCGNLLLHLLGITYGWVTPREACDWIRNLIDLAHGDASAHSTLRFRTIRPKCEAKKYLKQCKECDTNHFSTTYLRLCVTRVFQGGVCREAAAICARGVIFSNSRASKIVYQMIRSTSAKS